MNSIITPEIKKTLMNNIAIQQDYLNTSGILKALDSVKPVIEQYHGLFVSISDMMQPIKQLYQLDGITAHIQQLSILKNYHLLYFHSNNTTNKYTEEDEKVNNKVVEEIFKPESDDEKDNHAIITLSPINDKVLQYLSENPKALYQLKDREFEVVMAEIYNKLGYEVELTKATRYGGKDIIIRKPEILGDLIYYVECKQNAPKRHVGVGIIRNLIGTINTDRVNGGILATTSYFTPDAKKFITDNKYGYQIQMHDYDVIRSLLNRVF